MSWSTIRPAFTPKPWSQRRIRSHFSALVDTRRRGIEYSMDSDRPGMLIRKKLMELLAAHGEAEVHG